MRIVFFKRPLPRQFDYKPIYWDQEKEEMEERRKRLSSPGKEKTADDLKSNLKYDIDRNWRRKKAGTAQKVNLVRFLVYFGFALLLIYFIFFTDFISKFLSYFVE